MRHKIRVNTTLGFISALGVSMTRWETAPAHIDKANDTATNIQISGGFCLKR
jgi:hypothetical protein